MNLEDLPVRIVLDWNRDQIEQERRRVAGNIESSRRYLDVLDAALARLS